MFSRACAFIKVVFLPTQSACARVCVCVFANLWAAHSLHLSYYYRQLGVNLNPFRQAGDEDTIHYLHNQAFLSSLTQKE